MLLKRIVVSLLFVPILVFTIISRQRIFFFLLILGIIILGMREFYEFSKKKIKGDNYIGVLGGIILSIGFFLLSYPQIIEYGRFNLISLILFSILSIIFLRGLFTKDREDITLRCGFILLGVMYISFFLSHLLLIKEFNQGKFLLFLVFGVTWIGEVFAYGFGSLLGRNKLASKISPNKTVEGFLAGILGGTLYAVIISYLFLKKFSYPKLIFMSIVLGIWGQLGDLTASLFKRDAKVKDSGSIIPGHGGILDVFDGIIFNAPLCYYLSLSLFA